MLCAQQPFLWGRNVAGEEMSQQSVSPGTPEYFLQAKTCESSTPQNTDTQIRGVDKLPYTSYWKAHAGRKMLAHLLFFESSSQPSEGVFRSKDALEVLKFIL